MKRRVTRGWVRAYVPSAGSVTRSRGPNRSSTRASRRCLWRVRYAPAGSPAGTPATLRRTRLPSGCNHHSASTAALLVLLPAPPAEVVAAAADGGPTDEKNTAKRSTLPSLSAATPPSSPKSPPPSPAEISARSPRPQLDALTRASPATLIRLVGRDSAAAAASAAAAFPLTAHENALRIDSRKPGGGANGSRMSVTPDGGM